MKLFYSPNSPFARKVLICAIELDVDARIERIPVTPHPINRNQDLVALNPLGQVPTLKTADGEVICDSRVICEYLAALAAEQKVFPQGPRRFTALTEQSLCDGLLAACLSIRYERSTRPEASRSAEWIGGQMAKIESVLDELNRRYAPPPAGFDIGHVSVACVTGYLAFRFPEIELAPRWPNLAAYDAHMNERPSFVETIPAG
ncbi:glutathione S-transferase family protein [Mesorhizobium sp. 1B3]|uniref:glutathione S-transferase family protein n=1 Tax=Mesorhizobium sp. 1B3 TaxID=3243599 RepID=UPI003D99AE82